MCLVVIVATRTASAVICCPIIFDVSSLMRRMPVGGASQARSGAVAALVSDGQDIYRIGGLSFENQSSEPTRFRSTAHFARYDIDKNQWTDLSPLPQPRSSLDAAVLGRSIYVAGGWNLKANRPAMLLGMTTYCALISTIRPMVGNRFLDQVTTRDAFRGRSSG